MSVFVDTSALLAVLHSGDENGAPDHGPGATAKSQLSARIFRQPPVARAESGMVGAPRHLGGRTWTLRWSSRAEGRRHARASQAW